MMFVSLKLGKFKQDVKMEQKNNVFYTILC